MIVELSEEERTQVRSVLSRASAPTGTPGAGIDWMTLFPLIMKIIAALIAALNPPSPPPPGKP